MKDLEHQEQCSLITWTNYAQQTYPELNLIFAIPNGGKRNPIVAANLKAEGVKSGVPDLMLPVARGEYHGLFIEMKSKKGRESANQILWRERLTAQNYKCVVCYSWLEAKDVIINYLNLCPHRLENLIREAMLIGVRDNYIGCSNDQ